MGFSRQQRERKEGKKTGDAGGLWDASVHSYEIRMEGIEQVFCRGGFS